MVERMIAKKLRVIDVTDGKYFSGDKETMRAGYILTSMGDNVTRINLIGAVTEKFESEKGNFAGITIDDESGAIGVRVFNEEIAKIADVEIGDHLIVIGKVRNYNGENYISPEVVRKIEDSNLENLRRIEILKYLIDKKKMVDEIKNLRDEMSEDELKEYMNEKYGIDQETLFAILESRKDEVDYKPKVLELIGKLDNGEGVLVAKIFESLSLKDELVESVITELLSAGLLYEPVVGKLKKV